MDAAIDAPSISELWQTRIEARYPKEWEQAQGNQEAQAYAAAQRKNDACETAKARFALETKVLGSVNQQQFRDWEQFHEQRYAREQRAIDAQSGFQTQVSFRVRCSTLLLAQTFFVIDFRITTASPCQC